MMAMALVALAAGAVDHLYIENVNIGAITAGQTFDVEVSLQNETVYSAMQVDVALTAGLEMVRDDEGYVCWLSPGRATNNHVLSVYEQEDGALRVFVTTQNARALKNNDGVVFTMSLRAKANYGDRESITLRHCIAVEEDATKHSLADVVFNLFEAGNKYDVNGDGNVDVGDVNAVLADILAGGTTLAYDVNGDGHVDVGDVNAILTAILAR